MLVNTPDGASNYYATAGNLRSGNRLTRTLLTGRESSPDNFKFNFGGGGDSEDWTTPRHRHNFEQVRYPLSGDYVIAKNKVLPSGWVAYFPESAYYGPQVKSGNLTMLSLQFGGPSGTGYWSVAQRKKGYEDLLAKGGKFDEGIYSWVDETGQRHNQDAAEAVWEQIYGRKIEYPKPRYPEFVVMDPDSFTWIRDADEPGVAWKKLGSFTEREIRVAFIRLDKGARLPFGREKAGEILFIKEGSLSHDDKSHGRHSAFHVAAGEQPVTLTALEPSELFYVKLPTF